MNMDKRMRAGGRFLQTTQWPAGHLRTAPRAERTPALKSASLSNLQEQLIAESSANRVEAALAL